MQQNKSEHQLDMEDQRGIPAWNFTNPNHIICDPEADIVSQSPHVTILLETAFRPAILIQQTHGTTVGASAQAHPNETKKKEGKNGSQ
jgi:hypothetical protein